MHLEEGALMKHRVLTVVLAVLLVASASANENDSAGGELVDDAALSERFDLGVIEVTGVQGPDDGLDYPGVEVLTTEEMQRHERYDVAEALNLLPGVTAQNVGNRSESFVFLRGFDSRQEIGRAHVELQSLRRISYAVFCLKK